MSRTSFAWIVVGLIGWAGVVAIGLQLAAAPGGRLGFDLELLLQGGRDVAAGVSPYDPALLAGVAPDATSLFYSYPPPIAQAMAVVAGVPSGVMLVGWAIGAVVGLAVVAEGLRRRLAPDRRSRDVVIATVAGAPLVLPFAVGLLFGNVDVWFPLLYGTMLLGAIAPSRGASVAAGLALVVAALKLHPASLGLWFLVRGLRERRERDGSARYHVLVVVTALVAGGVVLVASLVVGGAAPWLDYGSVIRAGSGAVIVDPRNAGPAALIASALGLGDGAARSIHVAVAIVAVLVTAVAAWARRDPVESFTWAAAASLTTLPVTWYHYPSAFIPMAIACLLRCPPPATRTVRLLVIGAGVMAALALAWLPLVWVAIGLVVLAARASAGPPDATAPAAG